ncbi:hypothetical protein [Flavobacterium piscis]|uniref:Uncharacterized protein n=1 Tax=Flavobacterium piscis TaxID=1114874 RepID=A0ABU1YCV8_9FLAO|nr:hypothetical protein [Flavobacterium piscis]MDR7212076.1 hypothetical protein [Flavobacterium piscis]
MYVIKITQNTEAWLMAICQHKNDALTYLETLSDEIQGNASFYEIEIKKFPLVVIENIENPHGSASYFEFCTIEELQARMDLLRIQITDDPEQIYFKYYFIDEEYFQGVSEQNYMQYLRHTLVTNQVLEEPYVITVFHEEIKKYVSNYDIDGLDKLFEKTKNNPTSKLEKENLAINGYDNLFWEMNYDHACGKLTKTGIEYLLPMVENMEALLEEKKWQHRSFALHILLEEACKDTPETALVILKDTVEAFEQYLISHPEEKLEIHRLLSLSYRWMTGTDKDTAFPFWQLAVQELEKAIDFDPEKASWASLLELIYIPFSEDQKIKEGQAEAQKLFITKMKNLETTLGTTISYQIALAYQHLNELPEWKKIEHIFPETSLLHWAEKAIAYNPDEITRIDLYQCAQFFNKIGLRTKRIDFLVKTISLYERVLKATDDCAMEVYYIANLWKQIADIHIENHAQALADEAIMEAKSLYEKHIDQIKTNSSAYLHYVAFLDYCYTYEGNTDKPALAELKISASEVETQSEGFLSSPYKLLMHLALYEDDEFQAIVQATKCLILHELCADSTFYALYEEFKDSDFSRLKKFLKETKQFMEEVDKNYYYNPEINWKKLSKMSDEELLAYWEKRKEEIRNRPLHNIE